MFEIFVPDEHDSMSSITLGETEYYLRFTYNSRFDFWSVGIYDSMKETYAKRVADKKELISEAKLYLARSEFTEDEINSYLDTFGLTPAETNRPIDFNIVTATAREQAAMEAFIVDLQVEFPSSDLMSSAARKIFFEAVPNRSQVITNPDRILLAWTDEEYKLFRALEHSRYGDTIDKGFSNVEDFVAMANKVLNRRKSRAGKSLEHHLSAIFDENRLHYTAQAITEGSKRPDFIFPSDVAYHDFSFPVERLTSLAAKTTCKDRWRQILNEADRLRDRRKYLCTLQQGISAKQMDEMEAEGVILVVPKPYIQTYPKDHQGKIWPLHKFISYVKELERG